MLVLFASEVRVNHQQPCSSWQCSWLAGREGRFGTQIPSRRTEAPD